MTPLLILLALVVVPIIALVILKINATLVFLSLCLGDVLLQFVGADVLSVVSGASTQPMVTSSNVKLVLLLAPAILTAVFMLKTVKGSKRFLNVLPAIGTGLLVALLVVPLLPPSLARQIANLPLWIHSQPLQSAVVGGSAAVCLLSLWFNRPKHGGEKEGKKHKG